MTCTPLKGDPWCAGLEQVTRVELVKHPTNQRIELGEGQLALVLADQTPLRVEKEERRPGAPAEPPPDLEVTVIDNRMLDPVAQDGLAQVCVSRSAGNLGEAGLLWEIR
jgi:hypothetical protein